MFSEADFPKDRSLKAIIAMVLAMHGCLILWMGSLSTWEIQKEQPKRMVVKTVKLSPKRSVAKQPIAQAQKEKKVERESEPVADTEPVPRSETVKEPEPIKEPEIKKPAEIKVEPVPELKPVETKPIEKPTPPPTHKKPGNPKPPAPKKEVKKKAPEKQMAKKNNPAKKPPPKQVAQNKPPVKKKLAEQKKPEKAVAKASPKKDPVKQPVAEAPDPRIAEMKRKQRDLLKQAKEKIGKIGAASDRLPSDSSAKLTAIATPSQIESLNIDTLWIDTATPLSAKETAYRDELAHRLKLLLKFPEYGEVKVKLTVDRSGKVVSLKILNAQSAANRAYIEKTVPKLQLPPFGQNFGTVSDYAFTVTLKSE